MIEISNLFILSPRLFYYYFTIFTIYNFLNKKYIYDKIKNNLDYYKDFIQTKLGSRLIVNDRFLIAYLDIKKKNRKKIK